MKVKYIHCGMLLSESGELFVCDCDGFGNIMSTETGVLYKASKYDEQHNIAEIEML